MVGVMVAALILLLSRNELLFDELVAVPNSDARRAKRRGHEPDDADADAVRDRLLGGGCDGEVGCGDTGGGDTVGGVL